MELLHWILVALYLLLVFAAVISIITDSSNSNPSKAIAWLFLIMFLPFIGALLYFIFGLDRRRLGTSEKEYKEFIEEILMKLPPNVEPYITYINQHVEKVDGQYLGFIRLLHNNNHSGILYGSDVELITDGSRKLKLLMEDIENAKHHIHMEYFLFRTDKVSRQIRDLLMKKAAEGVQVRFVYDNIANITILPTYYNKMRKSGVEVRAFTMITLSSIRRSLNNRNHRKVAVIDGKIGYIGGMNITTQTLRWRDTHLRIQGEGVHGLQINFLQTWYGSGGKLPDNFMEYFPQAPVFTENLMQIVPEAPDSKLPYYALAVVKAITNAKKYIYIQTPYFLPTDSVVRALKTAVLSGVEVRLMTSRKSDYIFMDWAIQANYTEMLESGVHIHEIQSYFSHSKCMVIDDYLTIVGSSNFDYRSLELNFEINSFMYDPKIASLTKDIFLRDVEDNCREITLEDWINRAWWIKVCQTIMRFFTPLL